MIKAVIFDLGNVLLHFDHRIIMRRIGESLERDDISEGQMKEFRAVVDEFELGNIKDNRFVEKFGEIFCKGEQIAKEEFIDLWSDIFWVNQGVVDLVAGISPDIKRILLSNTNPIHFAFVKQRFPAVFEHFDKSVLSYETGLAKPENEIFGKAVKAAGVEPGECLYFDDIGENVQGAIRAGIHSHQYVSVQGLKDILATYELRIH